MMTRPVKIVECPRDAWQSLPFQIPSEAKAAYLRKLVGAGFKHIDAVSFVSPTVVPQMADSERVLELLGPVSETEIIGVVVNAKGAERAISTGAVHTLGFPYSISPEFLKRNQRQTPEEALDVLETIATLANDAGLGLVVYISMAFGNPYGDVWSMDEVSDACELLSTIGIAQVSLADTVGLAESAQISEVFSHVSTAHPGIELGVHLHARPGDAAEKIRAAYHAGCRRFDAAIGGLGGCPFAQDLLVGNIPTEILTGVLADLGTGLSPLYPLAPLIADSADIARRFGTRRNEHVNPRSKRLSYKTLFVSDEGSTRTITLNRPERRNAMTPEMQTELVAAMDDAGSSSCRVVVFAGAGVAFCSGLDLSALQGMVNRGAAEHGAATREDAERIAKLFRTLYELPKPTIAAVHGAAIAGGTGIATLCDFTLAVPSAKFGYTEVRIGFVPAIVSAYLALQIGDKPSRDLLLTGRLFDAAEAHRLGLVNEIVSPEAMLDRVNALAAQLAANSPASLAATKRLLAKQNRAWLDAAISEAIDENARVRETPDFREGVTAFLEKRTPTWSE